MKPRLKLAVCSALFLVANSALVSCKDEPAASAPLSSDTTNTPEPLAIGSLEGTIGNETFSSTLNTRDSTIHIEEWDGLSAKSEQRDGDEMSLEAFLMGTDLWSGPPRLVTITHRVDNTSLTLRFAGRLAVDETLTALPGCLIETTDAPLVPIAKGSWTTATDVTLPRYDLIFLVTSFDETSKVITGVIKGQLINPTKPGSDPVPIQLTLTSKKAPEPVAEPEARIPPDEVITEAPKPIANIEEEVDATSAASEQSEVNEPVEPEATPAEVTPAEATPAEATPAEEDDVEIRRAIPFTPQDDASEPNRPERRGFL